MQSIALLQPLRFNYASFSSLSLGSERAFHGKLMKTLGEEEKAYLSIHLSLIWLFSNFTETEEGFSYEAREFDFLR